MKLSEIISQVNTDTDQLYTNSDITNWVNRCLDELTPIARKEVKKTTDIVDSNEYSIPDDCFDIQKIMIYGDEYDYTEFADSFEIVNPPTSGIIELYYIRNLNHLVSTELDVVPEIEAPYHDLFILYAAAMSQYKEEELQKQADVYNRYEQRKSEYDRYINRKKLRVETIKDVYGINFYNLT